MRNDEQNRQWMMLALTPEVQPRHIPPLAEAFGSIKEILSADHLRLGSVPGLAAGAAAAIASGAGKQAAEAESELLEANGISVVGFGSPDYPALLRSITDPPAVLYCRGSLQGDRPRVAMVGSRNCSAYAAQVAHRLAGDLAQAGVEVVSGMANGIDQAAHNGALAAGGITTAVLGSGLGNIYPRGTATLVERLCETGAVITEFPWNTPPSKSTFPQRNRIVSGMCHATVVVEAAERSGALITARLALEQDREVLAVPGPVYEKRSFGNNYLIKKGAKLIQRVEDILEELPRHLQQQLSEVQQKAAAADITAREKNILTELSVDRPVHIDIIADRLGMSTSDISLLLLGLEMKGLLKQLPGMEYIKTI